MHVPQRDRFLVFRDFVRQTFPQESLKSGVILDVAGGKGDLSWVLTNADGLDAVIVDPRPSDHRKIARTAQWYWDHRDEDLEQLAAARGPQGFLASLQLPPPFATARHLQVPLDADLLDALHLGDEGAEGAAKWAGFWEASQQAAGAEAPASAEEAAGCCSRRITDASEARAAFSTARLILGFHPDQATDSCIDLALRTRTPFVVCPCCVFPAQFPARRLGDRKVKTYSDYIMFLRLKHPRIRSEQLPFDQEQGSARNVVLYMLPEDFDAPKEIEPPPPPAHPLPAGWRHVGGGAELVGAKDLARLAVFGEAPLAEDAAAAQLRDHAAWAAALSCLPLVEFLMLRGVSRRWRTVCFVLSYHEHPRHVKKAFLKASRKELQGALATLRGAFEGGAHVGKAEAEEGLQRGTLRHLYCALSKGLTDGELVDFSAADVRWLYFFRHLPVRCWHLPHVLLAEEDLLRRLHRRLVCPLSRGEPRCRVASLGGGPGFDAVGLSLMAAMQHLHVKFEVSNFDIEGNWAEVVDVVAEQLCAPLGHRSHFGVCDITEGLDAGANAALSQGLGAACSGFELIAVEFVVAENALKLEATDFLLFRQLFRRVPPATVFIFMDATHRNWARLVQVASEEGHFEVALPKFETGKSLWGFPKHVLVLQKEHGASATGITATADVRERLAWFESHRAAHLEYWQRRRQAPAEDAAEAEAGAPLDEAPW